MKERIMRNRLSQIVLLLLCGLCGVSVCCAKELSEKVVITGDTMELKDHGNVTFFKGGVKLIHGTSILLGDTMRYDKQKAEITIHGNVRLRFRGDDAETVLARADHAVYREEKGTGHMWGTVEVIRTGRDETGQVNLYAKDLYFDNEKETVRATGSVHIIQADTEARSAEALLEYPAHTVTLTGGDPVFFRKDTESIGEYHGDTIVIKYREKKVILDRQVRGWMRLAKKAQEKPDKEELKKAVQNKKSERKKAGTEKHEE